MKVLHLNTSPRTGGAAIAAGRIVCALQKIGVEASLLTAPEGIAHTLPFLWERMSIWAANRFTRKDLFSVDIANAGTDITHLSAFQEADIIHLHWINQGFLSLRGLQHICSQGKPIIWTMHDMWPCTSICHHARLCEAFHSECRDCPYQPSTAFFDLAKHTFKRKASIYAAAPLHFVACSKWLEAHVHQSALTQGKYITSIANPIDTTHFHPIDKQEARRALKNRLPANKRLILFGSCKITDKRKGIDYLIKSVRLLAQRREDWKDKVGIVTFGEGSDELAALLPYPVYSLGYLNSEEEMAKAYQAADLYITPSLEENLPNTVMEAMACGLPCVSFHIGGLPEMIDHKENGYIAEYRSAEDLAQGLEYVLSTEDYTKLSHNAVRKVTENYSQAHIGMQYKKLYERALFGSCT